MAPRITVNSLRKRVWLATRFIRLWLSSAARMQIFVRVTKTGAENMPKTGAVLVVMNHCSISDPLLVFGALRRSIAFLAMAGLFLSKLLGGLLRWMGHIPVARGTEAAREAADAGTKVLQQGGVVGIFPEGKCSLDDTLLPAKAGLGIMAFRTGAAVVPIGLEGTRRVKPLKGRWRLGRRVTINIGRPMYAPYVSDDAPAADRQAFTDKVMAEVARLSGQKPAPTAS